MKQFCITLAVASFLLLSGCATFRTDMEGGAFEGAARSKLLEPTDVLFISRHLEQTVGMDAIPKLQRRHQILNGYDDILLDASHELSNLNRYAAYTEFASDMSDPKRLALKDSLLANYDMRIMLEIRQERSFSKYFLGTLGSVVSITLLPMPFTQTYLITVKVLDAEGNFIKEYKRQASTTKWVEAFLLPVYPFHTEKRKTEDIYVQFLHDVFREIDRDGILTRSQGGAG